MKQIILFALTILLGFCSVANAGVIVLEGNYMGKNFFVKNPFGGAGVGFCVFEVTINAKLEKGTYYISFDNDTKQVQFK